MENLSSNSLSIETDLPDSFALQQQLLRDTEALRNKIKQSSKIRAKMHVLLKRISVYIDADEMTPEELVKMQKLQKQFEDLTSLLRELKEGSEIKPY